MNKILLLFTLIGLFISCTDIPISNNRIVTEKKILGLWKFNDSLSVKIGVDKKGYGYVNIIEKKIKSESEISEDLTKYKLYFYDVNTSNRFFSVELPNKEKKTNEYYTYKYNFDLNGNLLAKELKTGNLKALYKSKENLESVENFQNLLKANFGNPNIYDETKVTHTAALSG